MVRWIKWAYTLSGRDLRSICRVAGGKSGEWGLHRRMGKAFSDSDRVWLGSKGVTGVTTPALKGAEFIYVKQ